MQTSGPLKNYDERITIRYQLWKNNLNVSIKAVQRLWEVECKKQFVREELKKSRRNGDRRLSMHVCNIKYFRSKQFLR